MDVNIYTPRTVRLTADNIDAELLPGDRFADDPSFGTVVSHRPARDGSGGQRVYTDRTWDILGLPQTVTILRPDDF